MHGNVAEWCLDQYIPDYYQQFAGKLSKDPWPVPTKIYPLSVRGGSWDDDAENLRSAARRGSNKDWKQQDPQLPQSIWYFTDALFLGFRVVRPLVEPSAEEMAKTWDAGITQ
jgi:formylglycine-generating enzyme required for sulfatase activity